MVLIGKTCCFTGHRPKYFAFRTNESDSDCILIKDFIRERCESLIAEHGVTHFYSGGALGVDTWAMEIVIGLKRKYSRITLECVLPYAGMPDKFAPADRERYVALAPGLDTVTALNEYYVPGCMQQRNEYMVDRSQYVIAVWNGQRSGTGNTVRYAKRLGRTVFRFNPNVG